MRSRVLLLAAQALLLGLTVAFLVVPASALFLARYGAGGLPYVYLAVAVLGVAVSRGLRRLQARLSLTAVAACCIGAYVTVVAAGWAYLRVSGQDWVSAVLLGLFPLAIPVGFVLVGTQAGRLLDVRAMKRYFARIVAGFSLGFAVGGAAAALLTGPLGGPVDLLLVDALVGAAFLGTAVAAGRRFSAELAHRPEHAPERPSRASGPAPRSRLVNVLFCYVLLSATVTQLLDYLVWERAAYHFPDPSDLARFQGYFGTAINVVALAFLFLVAGPLLVAWGERGGLAANPLVVVLLLAVSVVVGVVAGADATVFFVVLGVQQVVHIALTDGMTRSAINTSYQALDAPARLRAQTVVEAAGVPVALGFVGVMLLVFRAAHLDVRAVVVVTLVLSAVWLVLAAASYRGYRSGVLAQVTVRPWEPTDLLDSDGDAVDAMLHGDDPRDVVLALAAVRTVGARPTVELAPLLEATDPYVRLAVVCQAVGADGEQARAAEDAWLSAVSGGDLTLRDAALAGCAAAPDPWFVPHLLDQVSSSVPSASLTDAVHAHGAQLAPEAVQRLARVDDPEEWRRLTQALGVARDALADTPAGLPPLAAELDPQAARIARALAAADSLGGEPEVEPLRRALHEDVSRSAGAVADVLAMYHGHRRVERVVAGLGATVGDGEAMAVELLEVLEGRHAGARLAAVLDPDLEAGERLATLGDSELSRRTAADWVAELATDPDGRWSDVWLRTCALHAAPTVLGATAADVVRPWCDDADPVVAQTARAALARSEPGAHGGTP